MKQSFQELSTCLADNVGQIQVSGFKLKIQFYVSVTRNNPNSHLFYLFLDSFQKSLLFQSLFLVLNMMFIFLIAVPFSLKPLLTKWFHPSCTIHLIGPLFLLGGTLFLGKKSLLANMDMVDRNQCIRT